MKRKKIILVIFVIGILVLLGIFNYEKIKGFLYLNCIPYDMEISYHRPESIGGYASSTYYYRINTKNKKEYIITDYYVFGVTADKGEKGSHYSLEVKKLSDEQINKLIDYAKGESTYEPDLSPVGILTNTDYYISISYKGNTKYYKYEDFSF